MPKRILITGGCGFIGSNLIKILSEKGLYDEILVLDNEVTGSITSLSRYPHHFIRGDIRDQKTVDEAVAGVDAIVHLAADTGVVDSIKNPAHNFEVNVQGTVNILEAMRRKGVKCLVNASTGGAIIGDVVPPVHELMPINPSSAYGASKAAAEAYCSAYTQSYGLTITSLRFSNVYGPLSLHKGSVIAAFMKKILKREPCEIYGDGSQTRDFIFVGDLCQGIIKALEVRQSGVFQLGSGRPTSVNEIISLLKQITGENDKLKLVYHGFRVGEVRHNFTDISKAKQHLGFLPGTELVSGIKETWNYFIDNENTVVGRLNQRVLENAD
ncbi:SDR family NAD(P)-dependent oxidoreductase [Microbulbifer sp. MLAF003]|uniref:SDR family NAD(P)-dependent oxidoreductase n=1 Tax=unclassified Microbulbifer TaxID=2619833 RepID=UPI0024AD90C9|nr:SDR family NAD(P)-dependent oxidoreductase [Microbulbifer sp. MLAF003]WHI51270.1 SDR family NAD(P)-dependent oxidoreductase [Microbulbifer sp. MLAF003]WHI51273.1 SDR family NAD(P)-dependent oxidoreductase [Microbulbifer sp. MLAF003]